MQIRFIKREIRNATLKVEDKLAIISKLMNQIASN